jgi:hypothetical protein
MQVRFASGQIDRLCVSAYRRASAPMRFNLKMPNIPKPIGNHRAPRPGSKNENFYSVQRIRVELSVWISVQI